MITNVNTTSAEPMVRKQQLRRWYDFDGIPFETTTSHNKYVLYRSHQLQFVNISYNTS